MKWAYCRLVVEHISQPHVSPVVNRSSDLNAIKPEYAKLDDGLDRWMDSLGELGWELVGVLSNGDVGHLLFRRPIE